MNGTSPPGLRQAGLREVDWFGAADGEAEATAGIAVVLQGQGRMAEGRCQGGFDLGLRGGLLARGDGLLRRSDDAPLVRLPASGRVQQGHVESSGVDPIETINAMMSAAKAAQADAREFGSLEVPMHLRNAPTKLMKELGYGENYRYAHDEEDAVAKGEKYFPDDMDERTYYHPVPRGLEIKIREKLAEIRKR